MSTMCRGGDFQMRIEIVPDSGTEELAGISGSMKITIEPGGAHFYDLDYDLAR
ncbi:MAG: DUF3224 domain-containing protein [Polyangiaceae bacterium]